MDRTSPKHLAISRAFTSLDQRASLIETLKQGSDDTPLTMSFNQLWQIAQDPFTHADLLDQVSANPQFVRQFDALIQRLQRGYNGAQAAAGTTDMTYRSGKTFDLDLILSSKGDGSAYLKVIFHAPPAEPAPQHLFYKNQERYHFLEMNPIDDRIMQILIVPKSDVFDVFKDPTTEFWVK